MVGSGGASPESTAPARQRPVAVIHIGMHKTGTTSIQHFLAEHRRELRRAGFVYPRSGLHGDQHAALPASMMRSHPLLPEGLLTRDPDPLIRQLTSEVPTGSAMLLSSEVFWELMTFAPEEFDRLYGRLLEDWRVVLVYFVRDAHEKAWSALKHMARTGRPVHAMGFYLGDLALTRGAEEHAVVNYPEALRVPYDGGNSITRFLEVLVSPRIVEAVQMTPERASLLRDLSGARVDAAGRSRLNSDYPSPCSAAVTIGVAECLARSGVEKVPAGLPRLYSALFRLPGSPCAVAGLPSESNLRERARVRAGGQQEAPLLSESELRAVRSALASGPVRRRAILSRTSPALEGALTAVDRSLGDA